MAGRMSFLNMNANITEKAEKVIRTWNKGS